MREPPQKLAPLPRDFFASSAGQVAPLLIGHWLLRWTPAGPVGGLIVETEAYLTDDPACHAYRGESARNRTMFGPPGHAYVYLIYGFHHCVNAVCSPRGVGEAVLIRAIAPELGVCEMRRMRGVTDDRALTSGPGKLCSALNIRRDLDGADLCLPDSKLLIARNPERDEWIKAHGPVIVSTRIGITKAVERPLRFYAGANLHVSHRGRGARARRLTAGKEPCS